MRTASAIAVSRAWRFCSIAPKAPPQPPPVPRSKPAAQVPTDLALCEALAPIVRKPSALPLNEYQAKLGEYLRNFCHRDEEGGWKVDKRVRDTGPWIGTYRERQVDRQLFRHARAGAGLVLARHVRVAEGQPAGRRRSRRRPSRRRCRTAPSWSRRCTRRRPPPARASIRSICAPTAKAPPSWCATASGSHDGWFWGWFGWDGRLAAGLAARAQNHAYPFMGFGQYCTNCHASAKDNSTFSSLQEHQGRARRAAGVPQPELLPRSVVAEPAEPHPQCRARRTQPQRRQRAATVRLSPATSPGCGRRAGSAQPIVQDAVGDLRQRLGEAPATPTAAEPVRHLRPMPRLPQRRRHRPAIRHDASPGRTNKLINISPYGTWRGSPMGLAGRDPIFFAQLASETETFHPDAAADDRGHLPRLSRHPGPAPVRDRPPRCEPARANRSTRDHAERRPLSAGRSGQPRSRTTARSRATASPAPPAISMVLGKADTDEVPARSRRTPALRSGRRRSIPGLTGFATTFTGNFFVGPPDEFYGPFQEPKKKPMKQRDRHRSGAQPTHHQAPRCAASCHTVHLPILHRGKTIGHVYEQTTYPEWAFSDYRTGTTPDGALPSGPGAQAQSCQDCHMPNKDADGNPVPQQDRGDPGIHQLSAGRAHAAAGGDRPAGARGLRHAHAGRAERLPAQDGVAVPGHPRHPHGPIRC